MSGQEFRFVHAGHTDGDELVIQLATPTGRIREVVLSDAEALGLVAYFARRLQLRINLGTPREVAP